VHDTGVGESKIGGKMRVNTKQDWYRYFNTDIFNRTRTWPVLDFLKFARTYSGDRLKEFALRNQKVVGGRLYIFSFQEMLEVYKAIIVFGQYCKNGCHLICSFRQMIAEFIVSEVAPDDNILVQGNWNGDVADLSFDKHVMRIIPDDKWIKNLSRLQLIGLIGYENYLTIEELRSLADRDDAVIEFSLYDKGVGIHQEELICWEIRNY
jgi:hypothetical protein